MKFYETELKGAYIIELEKFEDDRGFFTRVWDKKIMQDQGLKSDLVQMSFSFSKKKGTLRGMHFQKEPYQEVKIVKCIQGKIFDVIIDLRVESKTYKKWIGVELSADKQKMIYVPEGFAHGFQTLEENTHVLYHMSNWFSPEHEKGIRWDDKDFNIKWPITDLIISKKDLSHKKEEY
jgi:dTDP-4-dehydrorhamnose 3,5-epimerase